MKQEMTGAEIVLQSLVDQGVEVVFGYPGGAVLPIYDTLFKQNSIKHVLVRQEGGAIHAAEGYARSTGKVGVVLVTSGPGATNVVTGLTDAMMDSIPIVCITGQVPQHLIGSDAFQECDTTGITRPCTKHNYLVKDPNKLSPVFHEAFTIAQDGRPGPVLVDIPKDVQFAKGNYVEKEKIIIPSHRLFEPEIFKHDNKINEVVDLISKAKKPIFYIGGGCINSGPKASELVSQFVEITGAPATMTLMGLGVIGSSHPNSLGMLGMHGMYEANMAMHECDVMVNIGARFDDRVTGRLDAFSPNSKKIHIDIDESNINKTIKVDVPVVGDVTTVLTKIIQTWKDKKLKTNASDLKLWWDKINNWKKIDCLNFSNDEKEIKPQYAIQRLYDLTKDKKTFITTEVGQHQMWAAQFYRFEQPRKWITSGGLGTMGFGLPAALGAQVAFPDQLVVDIAGDGSFEMTLQELSTAQTYGLPVKIVILNNGFLGMVRQWQELFWDKRYSNTSFAEFQPDFAALAGAYGIPGMRVEDPSDLDDALRETLSTDGPALIDIQVNRDAKVFPMVPQGKGPDAMLVTDPSK